MPEFKNSILPDVLELKNINQVYIDQKTKKEHVVIKDLNFLIEDKPGQGQFVCILGKSGCGKSTILKYIAGLQEPTSGEVLFYGKPRTKDVKVGMVFQKYSSYPWLSVIENIEFGLKLSGVSPEERRSKAKKMIEVVGLIGHENKYPAELSGGQQQRVAIGRSFLCGSNILLLDEPFSALDCITRLKMQDFLYSLWKNSRQDMTIILVTHDISEAIYLSDEIWVMSTNPGKIYERISIDIPIDRSTSIKRTKQFQDYVFHLEDILYEE
jgi:NitT/TauT family transport system ATP-binding protein